jgi:hypothetical protein
MFKEGTGYSYTMKDSKGPYKKNSFEFVAAYVIPENVWYMLYAALKRCSSTEPLESSCGWARRKSRSTSKAADEGVRSTRDGGDT